VFADVDDRSQEVFYCTTMHTSTFSVYSAKKFPGMQRGSYLASLHSG
jgi:hypothetical protein